MKMGTMNISLTPEQAVYVRRTAARGFGNASEFLRDLLRERMKREIEADLALLQSTTAGAPAGPSEAGFLGRLPGGMLGALAGGSDVARVRRHEHGSRD